MKAAPFAYRRPETEEEAVAILGEYGSDASVLAGGQSLVPVLNLRVARPAVVVDINRVTTLGPIDSDDRAVRLGALVRQNDALSSSAIQDGAGLLAEALPFVGYPETRSRGTIVGSLTHNDPAAEVPVVALALDGEVILRSVRGERAVKIRDYLIAPYMTAREPDELAVAVRLPRLAPSSGFAFEEIARRHHDFALVAVAAVVRLEADGTVAEIRLCLGGVDGTAVRATRAEDLVRGAVLEHALIEEAAAAAAEAADPPGDVLASAAYRRHVAKVLSTRALARALARVKGDA